MDRRGGGPPPPPPHRAPRGLDGNPLFYRDGSDVTCGQTTYQQHSINISSYADGLSHHLQIIGDNESVLFGATNFFVDDVQLIVCL